jgi:hypothetical protein
MDTVISVGTDWHKVFLSIATAIPRGSPAFRAALPDARILARPVGAGNRLGCQTNGLTHVSRSDRVISPICFDVTVAIAPLRAGAA